MQWCRLRIELLERTVKARLATFVSVALVVIHFFVMTVRCLRFVSQGKLHLFLFFVKSFFHLPCFAGAS